MVVRRGLIVVFRALITAGVHLADVQSVTEEFLRWLQKKPVSHDSDASGGKSTMAQRVTPPQPKPEAPSEKGRSLSAEPARGWH